MHFSLEHFAHHRIVDIFNKHQQKPLKVPVLRVKWKHNNLSFSLRTIKPLDVNIRNENLTCMQLQPACNVRKHKIEEGNLTYVVLRFTFLSQSPYFLRFSYLIVGC